MYLLPFFSIVWSDIYDLSLYLLTSQATTQRRCFHSAYERASERWERCGVGAAGWAVSCGWCLCAHGHGGSQLLRLRNHQKLIHSRVSCTTTSILPDFLMYHFFLFCNKDSVSLFGSISTYIPKAESIWIWFVRKIISYHVQIVVLILVFLHQLQASSLPQKKN